MGDTFGMRRFIALSGLVLVSCALFVSACGRFGVGGCQNDNDCKGDRVCKSGECVDPGGGIHPPADVSGHAVAGAAPAVPALAPRRIGAGSAPDGTWTASFKLEYENTSNGLSYVAAEDACSSKGLALCIEAQWVRACADDPQLGGLATWTLSPSGADGFVVRGGGSCSSRAIARGREVNPARAGVCCERAVGIRTSNTNDAFLKSSTKKILDLESANNRRDTAALEKLYDDGVTFLGREYSRADLLGEARKYFKQFPDQWLLYDACDVRIEKRANDAQLVSECTAVGRRGGEVAVVIQRITHGGPEGRIQQIDEPRTIRKYSPQ